jgi:hypothetical protein
MGYLEEELRSLFEQVHQAYRWYMEDDWKTSSFILDTAILTSTRLKLFPKLFYYVLILRLELAFHMDSSSLSLLQIHMDRLVEFQQWNECIYRTKSKRYLLYDESSLPSLPITSSSESVSTTAMNPSPSSAKTFLGDRRQPKTILKKYPEVDDKDDTLWILPEHVTSALTYYRIRLRIIEGQVAAAAKGGGGGAVYDDNQTFSMIHSWMTSSSTGESLGDYATCRSSLDLLYAYLLWRTRRLEASTLHLANMRDKFRYRDRFILWNNLACVHLSRNRPACARILLLNCFKHLRQVISEGESHDHTLVISSSLLKSICHNWMIISVRLLTVAREEEEKKEITYLESLEYFIEHHHLNLCK